MLLIVSVLILTAFPALFVGALVLGGFAINVLKVARLREFSSEAQRALIQEGRGYFFTPLIAWMYKRCHRL